MPVPPFLANFSRLIFPHNCAGCGSELHNNQHLLCWKCLNELPTTGFEKFPDNLTASIFTGRMPLQYAFSWLFYNKGSLAQHLIHQIKYKKNLPLGRYMGQLMGKTMVETGLYSQIDLLVPLPLNKRKLASRGYNQAMLLCQGIADELQKPVVDVAVMRNKHTQTQTKKSRIERLANVEEVFDLQDAHLLENKHALLVDDVITTGATLEACGLVLLKVPGLTLSLASLAAASKI